MQNRQINRLWVDLPKWCTSDYVSMFEYLEEQDILDPDNQWDMWALHFCYMPMLNRALDRFCETWNHHKLSTEHNESPALLWERSECSNNNLRCLVDDCH